MDSAFAAVLDDYHARMADERADRSRSTDERLLAVGEETATLLNLLVKGAKAQRILELGTSFGYSTLWFAEAARATGGTVVTLDVKAHKQDYARAALKKAGLEDVVRFHAGDATEILKTLEGPFDFVLVDLWKDLYIPCFELFYPKLAPGALIAADNMLFPPSNHANATEYREAVRAKPHITSMLLPVGQGIELSRFTGGLPPELV